MGAESQIDFQLAIRAIQHNGVDGTDSEFLRILINYYESIPPRQIGLANYCLFCVCKIHLQLRKDIAIGLLPTSPDP